MSRAPTDRLTDDEFKHLLGEVSDSATAAASAYGPELRAALYELGQLRNGGISMNDRMSTEQCSANLRALRSAVRGGITPDDDQRTLLFLAGIVDELLRANDSAKHDATGGAIARLREAVRP